MINNDSNLNEQIARQSVDLGEIEQTFERQRLAKEFHDSLTQLLYSIALNTNSALLMLNAISSPDTVERLKTTLEGTLWLTEGGLAELQNLFYELRPDLLNSRDLVNRLNSLARILILRHRFDVKIRLCESEPDIPQETKLALYYIAQEACFNIIKHSKAKHINIDFNCTENKLSLEISDDGRGFSQDDTSPKGSGLTLMQNLAQRINGNFTVDSVPGHTFVRIETSIG